MAFQINNDVRFRVMDDEAVLVRQGAGEAFVLNQTGAVLLPLLEAGAEHEVLVEALVTEFDVSDKQAERDVQSFVSQLREHSIITKIDGEEAESEARTNLAPDPPE